MLTAVDVFRYNSSTRATVCQASTALTVPTVSNLPHSSFLAISQIHKLLLLSMYHLLRRVQSDVTELH